MQNEEDPLSLLQIRRTEKKDRQACQFWCNLWAVGLALFMWQKTPASKYSTVIHSPLHKCATSHHLSKRGFLRWELKLRGTVFQDLPVQDRWTHINQNPLKIFQTKTHNHTSNSSAFAVAYFYSEAELVWINSYLSQDFLRSPCWLL